MAEPEQVLAVDDLHVSYGGVRALQGVSLEVNEGEIVVLLGANGAGKTTLLSAVSNLVPAQRGSVRLWGRETLKLPPYEVAKLGVAHVPEGRGVFAGLSVRENLLMGAFHVPPGERRGREAEVVELFPRLQERWGSRAGNLSGGEQQMLAIARALVSKPRLLILDEPSLGLAPLLARETFRAIEQINAGGMSVLVVEQNARLALQVAARAYVISNGRIEAQGTAAEVASMGSVQRAYLGVA